MSQKKEKQPGQQDAVQQRINRRTFLSFSVFAAASAAMWGGWRWLIRSPLETPGITAGAQVPFRRALNQNEIFWRRLFDNSHQVKQYPKSKAAAKVRVNGGIGLEGAFDAASWKLRVDKGGGAPVEITLDDLRGLPKTEIVFDFKCVEGWDQVQHWGGVRFSDFITHFGLDGLAAKGYVGLVTPDGAYYVGLDRASAMHPQTILAYEMNGQALRPEHGAPLRLMVPVKYGIKSLKRIGTISFSDSRPRDYWAEQGYDYYSGL